MEYRLDYVAILMGDVDVYGFWDAWPEGENKGESLWKFLPVSFSSFVFRGSFRIIYKCYNFIYIYIKLKN